MDAQKTWSVLTYDLWIKVWEHSNDEDWFKKIFEGESYSDLDDFDESEDAGDAGDAEVAQGSEGSEGFEGFEGSEESEELQVVIENVIEDRLKIHTGFLNSKLEKVLHFLGNGENSSLRGAKAEDQVERALRGKYRYIRNSKQSHSGDFMVDIEIAGKRYSILFEIKNYRGNIPSKEYDKFIEDLDRLGVDAGVYFAYSGYITGEPRSLSVSGGGARNVPIALVQNNGVGIIDAVIDLLRVHIALDCSNSRIADIDEIRSNAMQAMDIVNKLCGVKQNLFTISHRINGDLIGACLDVGSAIDSLRLHLNMIYDRIELERDVWELSDVPKPGAVVYRLIGNGMDESRKQSVVTIVDTIYENLYEKLASGNKDSYIAIKGKDIKIYDRIIFRINPKSQHVTIPLAILPSDFGSEIFKKMSDDYLKAKLGNKAIKIDLIPKWFSEIVNICEKIKVV